VASADDYYIELFSEGHVKRQFARLGPSLCSGFRRAAQFVACPEQLSKAKLSNGPRKRLNLASGVAGADYDYVELFSEGHAFAEFYSSN
jgi:hypothetical protein